MTPLARWVLLALLLVVEAHPHEHACVCLCRVQNGGPNIAEVCDDQRVQDLQSGASLHVVRDIFKLCLIAAPKTQEFSDAVCRGIWSRLVERHGCSCEGYRKLEDPEEQNASDMLNGAPAEDQRGWRDLPDDRISVAENAMDDGNASKDETEDPIDWEVWCIIQCENGQGGSACNCDIIP